MDDDTTTDDKKKTKKQKGAKKKTSSSSKSKTTSSSKKSKSSKKSTKSKKEKSIYDADDEYKLERRLRIKNTAFKTARMSWSKIITYPSDALVVEPPENNLTAIRDTFRSQVNVKLVYLEVLPPEKVGKKKKPKKGKQKKDKKQKEKQKNKKKGGKKSQKDSEKSSSKSSVKKEPVETILKKITLANFHCDLKSVNWSENTVDFYWSNHPSVGDRAFFMEGNLRVRNNFIQITLLKK